MRFTPWGWEFPSRGGGGGAYTLIWGLMTPWPADDKSAFSPFQTSLAAIILHKEMEALVGR